MRKDKTHGGRTFRSLTLTLSVLFLLFHLGILLSAIGLGTYLNFRVQRDLIEDQQRLIAREAAVTVKNFIGRKFDLLKATVNFGNLTNSPKDMQNSVLAKALGADHSFRQLVLLNASGRELTHISRTSQSASAKILAHLNIEDIMNQTRQDKEHLSSIYIYETTSEPMIIMAVPVENILGDFQGALVAEVNLKFMWDVVGGIRIGLNGTAFVVDDKGNLIASGDASRVLKGENLSRLRVVAEYKSNRGSGTVSSIAVVKGIQGTIVLSTYAALGKPDWAVVVELPFHEAYASVITALKLTAVIVCVIVILAVIAGHYFSKRISKPIINLRDAATKIGDGKLDTQIAIDTGDEIEELARAFNRMAEELENTTVSKDYVDNIINSMIDTLIVVSPEGKILRCNAAACKLLGYKEEELVGKLIEVILHEESLFKESLGNGAPIESAVVNRETCYKTKDGRLVPMLLSAAILPDEDNDIQGFVCVAQDITSQKKLEEQLRQSQKMEAIGTLTGGIAHDFNNILTAIMGYGNIIKSNIKEDLHLKVQIDHILTASEKAANLTQSLLAFSRKQISNPVPVNLNEIVKKVEKLLLRIIGEHIELRTLLHPGELIIMADSGQMEHVLMNMATNARDAMPTGGSLEIKTDVVELDEDLAEEHGCGSGGRYAVMSVTDTGIGIDEKIKDKIFDPFFTTKQVGKGTGLGLAMVYGIIMQHNGYINFFSERDRGTTFNIFLPLTNALIKPVEMQKEIITDQKGGAETILIAEDEAELRELSRTILEGSGYHVIESCNGEEAINRFLENKENIDLLLFDVVMPKLSGKEAYEKIREIRPEIKALFMSGYPTDFIDDNASTKGNFNFISKPAPPKLLLKKIRETLDKS